LNLLLHGWYLW